MIENTIDSKAVFFARYLGQKVLMIGMNTIPVKIERVWHDFAPISNYLLLTPLSMITDEHAIEVANIYPFNVRRREGVFTEYEKIKAGRETVSLLVNDNWQSMPCRYLFLVKVFDYLRSKGYYVGDGTEIKYGWAQLQTPKTQ